MFKELIGEYRRTGTQLKKLKLNKVREESEVTIINSMISEVGWAVKYMQDGFNPDSRRGIHSREISIDPIIMDSIFAATKQLPETGYVDQEMMEKAKEILGMLTPREREAFILVKVDCLSYSKAALEMGVTKARVQGCIIRAEEKIRKIINKEVKERSLAVVC